MKTSKQSETMDSTVDVETMRLLKKHQVSLKSRELWNKLAEQENVPTSKELMERYGSWRRIKRYAGKGGMGADSPRYTEEELLELLDFYQDYLIDEATWDALAIKFNLPPSHYLCDVFGDWTKLRVKLGLEEEQINPWDRPDLLSSMDELSKLLKKRLS